MLTRLTFIHLFQRKGCHSHFGQESIIFQGFLNTILDHRLRGDDNIALDQLWINTNRVSYIVCYFKIL